MKKALLYFIIALCLCAVLCACGGEAEIVNTTPEPVNPEECVHNFHDGVCVICGFDCQHGEYANGLCTVCSLACPHANYENSICTECGYECMHGVYDNGVCTECGFVCSHLKIAETAEETDSEEITGAISTEDAIEPDAEDYSVEEIESTDPEAIAEEAADEIADGKAEQIYAFTDGVCEICGYVCPHEEYSNGFCTLCGEAHEHTSHLPSDSLFSAPVCDVCGVTTLHNWVNLKCTICGQDFEFHEKRIPTEYVNGSLATSRGTVETVNFPSHFYNAQDEAFVEITRQMTVYLPPNYDENQKYDLIIFNVGTEAHSTIYFAPYHFIYYDSGRLHGADDMCDTLITNNLCKPFIAVTIEYAWGRPSREINQQRDSRQIANELRYDIFPFLCENYSIYPENASIEELRANREHLAYFGNSYGAFFTYSAMEKSFDIFGWYCPVSGGWTKSDAIAAAIDDSDLPLYFLYAVDGTYGMDTHAGAAKKIYYELDEKTDKLVDGVNGHAGTVIDGDHSNRTWLAGLFNFARLCFYT